MPATERLPTLREGRGQFVEFEPAELVPEFRLNRLDGRQVLLSSFRGNVLIVNFWASWCLPCRRELPLLEDFVRRTGSAGARAIAISLDAAGTEKIRQYLQALDVRDLPIFLDPDFRIAQRSNEATPRDPFRLFGLPLTYLLSPGGRNLGYFVGEVDWRTERAQALLKVAAGRP